MIALLIAFLYYKLGKVTGKNPIAWAFVGIGVVVTVQLMALPLVIFLNNPSSALVVWTSAAVLSLVIAVVLAYIIYHRYKYPQTEQSLLKSI